MAESGLYGLMAEFHDSSSVVAAARKSRAAGYTRLDAYTPFPIHELSEALDLPPKGGWLSPLVLLGGLAGAAAGFGLQYWSSVLAYPLNVGGRPLNSWPSFIPVTFETTVLFAAGTAVLGMLALNGLPRPHHPVFNAPNFALASQERFFLCIESADPRFDAQETRRFLEGLNAAEVTEVEY